MTSILVKRNRRGGGAESTFSCQGGLRGKKFENYWPTNIAPKTVHNGEATCPPNIYFFLYQFFFIGIVGRGGVEMGPLGTAVTNRPTVSAPGNYDDGETGGMIGRGNRSTQKKTCPSAALSTTNPTCECGLLQWEARDYPLELWHGLSTKLIKRKNQGTIFGEPECKQICIYIL
jgi:hypothetical protein